MLLSTIRVVSYLLFVVAMAPHKLISGNITSNDLDVDCPILHGHEFIMLFYS